MSHKPSRRDFLSLAAGALAAGALPRAHAAQGEIKDVEAFYGTHQAGIVTAQQAHTYFAAFDVSVTSVGDLKSLFEDWTQASAELTKGSAASVDSGEAEDLSASRLTLTFGFGASLFQDSSGKDRFGFAAKRPAGLVVMPKFNGDQLVAAESNGDLSVQACAEDPQVAFHALRTLAQVAGARASLRWTQTGFLSRPRGGQTPRNLMGFKDGTINATDHDRFVWAGEDAPTWMRGGSFMVVRKIRMALEHWDRMATRDQEQIVGRSKVSGAPLGGQNENDALNLQATDGDGNYILPEDSHVRLASPQANAGVEILRRGYAYNNGTNVTAERWPPWHQGLEYDAGLLFVSYQSHFKNFIRVFNNLAKFDALNQFTTHTGGGFFACPPGILPGGYLGQGLF